MHVQKEKKEKSPEIDVTTVLQDTDQSLVYTQQKIRDKSEHKCETRKSQHFLRLLQRGAQCRGIATEGELKKPGGV